MSVAPNLRLCLVDGDWHHQLSQYHQPFDAGALARIRRVAAGDTIRVQRGLQQLLMKVEPNYHFQEAAWYSPINYDDTEKAAR